MAARKKIKYPTPEIEIPPFILVRGPNIARRLKEALRPFGGVHRIPIPEARRRRLKGAIYDYEKRGLNADDLRFLKEHFHISPLYILFGIGNDDP